MMDSQTTRRLANRPTAAPTMTWVEVSDASGRRRLEARWSNPAPVISKPHAA